MSDISDESPARILDWRNDQIQIADDRILEEAAEEQVYQDKLAAGHKHLQDQDNQLVPKEFQDYWKDSLGASNNYMTIVDVINGTIPFDTTDPDSSKLLLTHTEICTFFKQFSGAYRRYTPAWLRRKPRSAYIAANITHKSKPQTNLRVIGCSFKQGSWWSWRGHKKGEVSIANPFNHTTHVKVVPYTTDDVTTYTREHYRDRQHGICNQLITILDEQINIYDQKYNVGRRKAAVVFCNYMLLRHTIKQGQLPDEAKARLSDHNETATTTAITALNADIAEVENASAVDRFIIHQIFMNKQILIDLGVPVSLNSELDEALKKYSEGQSMETYNPLHRGAGRRLNKKKKNKKISRNNRTKQIKRRNIKKRTNTKKKSKKRIRSKRVSRKMKRSRMRGCN